MVHPYRLAALDAEIDNARASGDVLRTGELQRTRYKLLLGSACDSDRREGGRA